MVAKKHSQKGGEHKNTTPQTEHTVKQPKKATIDCSTINEIELVKQRDNYSVLVPVVNKLDIIHDDISELKQCELQKIGEGAYNCVYSTLLSTDKCTNNSPVAVRITELEPTHFYDNNEKFFTDEPHGIQYGQLNTTYLNTLMNMVTLSKSKIHPKIYDIKIIKDDEINDDKSYWLVIVMDKYEMNLGEFLNKKDEVNKKNKDKLIQEENCKMLSLLISKTVTLYQNIGLYMLTCFDVKPENMVINFDEKKQEIDLKIIDVDSEWCKTRICPIKDILHAKYYKFIMLSLLAYHLFYRHKFNYLSPYFKAVESDLIEKEPDSSKKPTTFIKTFKDYIEKITNCETDYGNYGKGSFIRTTNHYFKDLTMPDDTDIFLKRILLVNKEGLTLDHIIVKQLDRLEPPALRVKISCKKKDQPLPEPPSTTEPEINPPQPSQIAGKKRSSSNKTKKNKKSLHRKSIKK